VKLPSHFAKSRHGVYCFRFFYRVSVEFRPQGKCISLFLWISLTELLESSESDSPCPGCSTCPGRFQKAFCGYGFTFSVELPKKALLKNSRQGGYPACCPNGSVAPQPSAMDATECSKFDARACSFRIRQASMSGLNREDEKSRAIFVIK